MGEVNLLLLQANGYFIDDHLYSLTTRTPQLSNPSPESVLEQCWERAEETAHRILTLVQPTVVAEQKRQDIIGYLQRLIGCSIGSEVFPFGSVPLKTYLPDGDIDLTAVSSQALEDSLASEVRGVLEREEHNKDAEFELQDVQFINAEVKLLKCLVQNIVIDISFNQLGGMCTLCFLEQGKDYNHLLLHGVVDVTFVSNIKNETLKNLNDDMFVKILTARRHERYLGLCVYTYGKGKLEIMKE